MTAYRVTAPYITPKVRDDAAGGYVHKGYYADAVLQGENIDPASLRHHLEGGMLAEVEAPVEAKAAAVEVPAEPAEASSGETPAVDTPPSDPAGPPVRPHGNASAATWLDYAVSLRAEGVSEEDARAALSEKTKAELIAVYGN